jgi:hypothetical protein
MNIKLVSIPFESSIDLEAIKLTLNNIPLLTLRPGFDIYEVIPSNNPPFLFIKSNRTKVPVWRQGGIDIYVGLFTYTGTLIKEEYWSPDCGDNILYKSIEEQLMSLLDN